MVGTWIANVLVQVNFADEGIKISETSGSSPKRLESFLVITSHEFRVTQRRDIFLRPATVGKKF